MTTAQATVTQAQAAPAADAASGTGAAANSAAQAGDSAAATAPTAEGCGQALLSERGIRRGQRGGRVPDARAEHAGQRFARDSGLGEGLMDLAADILAIG